MLEQDKKVEFTDQQQIATVELLSQAIVALLNQSTLNDDKQLLSAEVAWQMILASFEDMQARDITGWPHRWTRADFYDEFYSQRV